MLPKFTLNRMANGHTSLKIHISVNYENFPSVAKQLLSDLNGVLINRIMSADVLLWKIKIQGQKIDLVFDEMSGDLTLESDNKKSDKILQALLLNTNNKQVDQASPSTTFNKDKVQNNRESYLNEKILPVINRKFLLLTLVRLLILLGIISLALKSFWVNFIPNVQYAILSLIVSAPVSWLIFRCLLKPLIVPFTGLFPKFSFSWKELKESSKDDRLLYSGLWYKTVGVLIYLVRFKGFYIGLAYLFSYLAITFSVPVLLDDSIGQSFSVSSRLSDKSSSGSLFCPYRLTIKDYGNIFSTGICVSRSTYDYIEPGNSVKVSGIQSWAGAYIKDIFRSGSTQY